MKHETTTDLSRMNNTRSLENKPKDERQENPNKASVKKNRPGIHRLASPCTLPQNEHTQSVLEARDIVSANVMVK